MQNDSLGVIKSMSAAHYLILYLNPKLKCSLRGKGGGGERSRGNAMASLSLSKFEMDKIKTAYTDTKNIP